MADLGAMDELTRAKRLYTIQGILQLFVAIGAIPAGIMMILAPDGSSLGMEELVEIMPFENLIIPGILLIIINGLGQGIAGWLSLKRNMIAPYTAFVFGMGLIIWIVVQVIIFEGVVFLHVLYFIIGVIEVILSIFMYQSRNLITNT